MTLSNGRRVDVVALGNVCNLVNGNAYNESMWSTSGVPIIRIQNLNNAKKPFNYWAGPIDGCVIVKDGDVLLAWSGTPGTSFGAHRWHRGLGVLNQHIFRVDFDRKQLDPDWMVFTINEQLVHLIGKAHGAVGLSHVTRRECDGMRIWLPRLSEQRRIASRLKEQMTAVEQAREGIEVMRQGLDDLVAAWIREGIQDPDTTMQSVEEVLEEVTHGIGNRWAEFPVLGATRSGVAPAKEGVGKTPGRYKPVRPGSVFYNPMRIMIGSIAMLDEGDAAGITSPDYVVVRPRTEAVHHLWVYEWLRSGHGARFIQTLARGGVRERMLFTRLKSGDIPVPPQPWQQRFAEISRHRRQAVKLLDEQLSALGHLPGAYLREAFGNLQ